MFQFWAVGFGAEEPRFAKLPQEEEMLALALYSLGAPSLTPFYLKGAPIPPYWTLKPF